MAKVVFILGAGASRPSGVPIMKEFLDRAHELQYGGRVAREDFERVFRVIAALQILHAKSKTDLLNVESIFNLIEMAQLVGRLPGLTKEEIEPASTSIRRLLAQTIEQSCRFPIQTKRGAPEIIPDETYLQLADWLRTRHKEREFPPWVFITFNYDVALDYALHWSTLKIDYGLLQRGHDPRGVALLKLHGSLNWTMCGCGKEIAVLPFDRFLGPLSETARDFVHVPVTERLQLARHCDIVPPGVPAIVPPSWNKTQYQKTFGRIWERAALELSEAENVVVIGYSLPETDAFFRDLFRLGIAGPSRLKRFVVVSRDKAAHQRFRDLLGPELEQRFEVRDETFEDASRWITMNVW
jgi:hypothetical protein